MIAIASEINNVAIGVRPRDDNPLVNAPHTSDDIMQDDWTHPYSRKQAGDPEGNQQKINIGRQLTESTTLWRSFINL